MENSKTRLDEINSTEDLLSLQRVFAEIIRKPLTEDDSMHIDPRSSEMIQSNDRTSSDGRLEFYAQQYWWRIEDSFDEDFPSVKKLTSNDTYVALRDEYLRLYPSISFTLRNLGSRFHSFLGDKSFILADASKYDWARIEAFDAGRLEPISLEDVQDSSFSEKVLCLQPHVKLLSLNYPIQELNKSGFLHDRSSASNTLSERETPEEALDIATLEEQKTFLALHRLESKIYSKILSGSQFRILQLFQNGISLESLGEKVSLEDSHIIEQSFSEWMALGWLSLENINKEQ